MRKINKILIANRGEIALRIIRSAKEMGIKTVAVYSDADRNSLVARSADEAVGIGPAPSKESYLNINRIIEASKMTKSDAIHPGYGFLSENANFAERVHNEGMIFIGPSAKSIRIMGDKIVSKETVAGYDVPLIPGTDHAIQSVNEALKVASEISYPLMIKASAGGGGKGMRIVWDDQELKDQFQRAVSEAESAFGDGSVFIEKYITKPRHIEFQILADEHGHVVHLFERECSIQRRHQKVIEEAPSSVLTSELRDRMGETAVKVAKSCQYTGAGTVEFMLDEDMNFYFLEMNTRLQVEHPVTEMITGLDLVKEQIKIARGEPLTFTQEDLQIGGYAIEARIYAEDPSNNFLPDVGRISFYSKPDGIGVRVDDAYEQDMEIPIQYDPLIAKLITHGANRQEAIERMIRSINEYHISGVETTLGFCRFVMEHPDFRKGDFATDFIAKHMHEYVQNLTEEEKTAVSILASYLVNDVQNGHTVRAAGNNQSAWRNRLKEQ